MAWEFLTQDIRSILPFAPIQYGCHRFLTLFSLFLLLSLSTTPFAYADAKSDRHKEKEKLGRKIQMQEMNVIRLQEGLLEEKDNINNASLKEKSLLEKLETIDLRLLKQQQKLDILKTQMAEQKQLINTKENELQLLKSKKSSVQAHLQRRISAYYKLDRIGLINITFSAQTLPDILNFNESFQTLLTYDQDIISSYRDSIAELGRAREALTLEEGLLHEFIARTEKEKEAIAASKEEMEVLISHIRTQTKLHEQAILEIKAESDKLSSSLNALKEKEQILDQDFLLSKGTLPLPVNGSVLTLYGQKTTNNLGISKNSTGVSISAPDGTPVKAIFKGTIFFSGYLRGYGNTVIVHHDYQYYSVISRVEKLLKRKGDVVLQGDIIALMGDTAMLIEDGIQLEIRHGAKVLDPLLWIDKKKVALKKELH